VFVQAEVRGSFDRLRQSLHRGPLLEDPRWGGGWRAGVSRGLFPPLWCFPPRCLGAVAPPVPSSRVVATFHGHTSRCAFWRQCIRRLCHAESRLAQQARRQRSGRRHPSTLHTACVYVLCTYASNYSAAPAQHNTRAVIGHTRERGVSRGRKHFIFHPRITSQYAASASRSPQPSPGVYFWDTPPVFHRYPACISPYP